MPAPSCRHSPASRQQHSTVSAAHCRVQPGAALPSLHYRAPPRRSRALSNAQLRDAHWDIKGSIWNLVYPIPRGGMVVGWQDKWTSGAKNVRSEGSGQGARRGANRLHVDGARGVLGRDGQPRRARRSLPRRCEGEGRVGRVVDPGHGRAAAVPPRILGVPAAVGGGVGAGRVVLGLGRRASSVWCGGVGGFRPLPPTGPSGQVM